MKNDLREKQRDTNELNLPTWCGGLEGNKYCNYSCKLCLYFSKRAKIIAVDENCGKVTFVVNRKDIGHVTTANN